MGQAKQRGTFEQRKALAEVKLAEADRERREMLDAREAARTHQERDRSKRAAVMLTTMLGMAIACTDKKGLELARMVNEYGHHP